MNQIPSNRITLPVLVLAAFVLFPCAERMQATEISGIISTTLTIFEDSELAGDVTCMVAGAPCIALGAPGIKLRLNGFTITDGANTSSNCATSNFTQDGIQINAQHDVAILGPGLVHKFAGLGISLLGSTKVRVEGVTASDNCFSGIFLLNTTDSDIERNLSIRNSIGSKGNPCGGTWLASSHNNRVRLNVYSGNGSALSNLPSGASNNFGVGLVGTSKDNLIEKNKIGGNLNGVLIAAPTQGGNVIRGNIIAGNPPVQVSKEFGASIGADIQDLSAPGTNTFEGNRCLTYAGSMQPAPCPSIAKPDNDEDRQERDMAAFGRNRLAFPQARLINAVFRSSLRLLPSAAGRARPAHAAGSDSVTVTGKVVDAACFMLHASVATAASHKDCGAACLARGTPLAIATDDGALYFPADGNQRLKSLLNARVRASGTVVEKDEPMELKMPVGDKHQMVVRVEGGYKQITIQTLEKIPPIKRRPA